MIGIKRMLIHPVDLLLLLKTIVERRKNFLSFGRIFKQVVLALGVRFLGI